MGSTLKRLAPLFITALLATTAVTGCSAGDEPAISPPPLTPSASGSPTGGATPTEAPTESPKPAVNDLPKNKATRTVKAGPVTIQATYSTPLAIKDWKANGAKPLDVTITATDSSSRSRKVYLSRLTVTIGVTDATGELPEPAPLVDAANISPGYLVTSPNTYSQNFVIPDLDDGAERLTLSFRYELLLQQGSETTRDYSKQTATDTVRIPIAAP